MNAEQIVAKAVKGPRPNLGKFLKNYLAKHSERLEASDVDAVIANLAVVRNTAIQAEVARAQAEANAAAARAAELAAKAAAVSAPAAESSAAPVAA